MVDKIVFLIIGIAISISLAALATADTDNCVVESPHNYSADTDKMWKIDMADDATHMRLHFTKWELAGDDKIYIYDSDHKIIARNSAGANGESFWSCDLYSTKYVEIRLMSHGGSAYGFCIDQIYTDNKAPPENYHRSNYANVDRRGKYKGATGTEDSSTSSSQSGDSSNSSQTSDQSDSSSQVSTQSDNLDQSSTTQNGQSGTTSVVPQSQNEASPNPDVTPTETPTPEKVTTPVEVSTPVPTPIETPVEVTEPVTNTVVPNKAVTTISSGGSGGVTTLLMNIIGRQQP